MLPAADFLQIVGVVEDMRYISWRSCRLPVLPRLVNEHVSRTEVRGLTESHVEGKNERAINGLSTLGWFR